MNSILLIIVSYLLGSIPTAVWAGRWQLGIDLREHGSGNAGATNAFRVLGARTALAVLAIDMLKGVASVSLAGLVAGSFASSEMYTLYQFGLGLSALLGHVFPVFAGFRGGKGIATMAGVVIVLFPAVMAICLAIFLIIFLITRYVSLGSIITALAFPVVLVWVKDHVMVSELVFSLLIAAFVIFTHRKNIVRLLKGAENRISFRKPPEKQPG